MQWLRVSRKASDHPVEVAQPDEGVSRSFQMHTQRRIAPFVIAQHPRERRLQHTELGTTQSRNAALERRSRLLAAAAGILDRFPNLQGLQQERRRKRTRRQ